MNLNNVYNVVLREEYKSKFNLNYILTLLNSKYFVYLYQKQVLEKGRLFAEVKKVNLNKLPIKNISPSEQKPFIEKADSMLKLNKELYEKKEKFLKLIKHEYKIEKITKKLNKFYELEFDDFMKQLKVKLNMDKKSELLDFFEKNKKELQNLKDQIEKTDNEINRMVYKLYGLTQEDIKIVEESLK